MAYTTEITYTSTQVHAPTGRYITVVSINQESTQPLRDKLAELTASGDLVSSDIQYTGDNNKKMIVTRVWKNEEVHNAHLAWFESSGQKSIYDAHMAANGITFIKQIL